MIQSIILTIFCIMLVLALTYIAGCLAAKREMSSRDKHKDRMPVDNPAEDPSQPFTADLQRREAKDKMVADIRRYFNQRKNDAAHAKTPGVNPSTGSHEKTYPDPPSIQIMLE